MTTSPWHRGSDIPEEFEATESVLDTISCPQDLRLHEVADLGAIALTEAIRAVTRLFGCGDGIRASAQRDPIPISSA